MTNVVTPGFIETLATELNSASSFEGDDQGSFSSNGPTILAAGLTSTPWGTNLNNTAKAIYCAYSAGLATQSGTMGLTVDNGTQVTSSGTYSQTVTGTEDFGIMALDTAAYPIGGQIAEIITFSPQLTSTQRTNLMSYITGRYGSI